MTIEIAWMVVNWIILALMCVLLKRLNRQDELLKEYIDDKCEEIKLKTIHAEISKSSEKKDIKII